MNFLENLKQVVLSSGSKSAKIEKFMKEYNLSKIDAENTYQMIVFCERDKLAKDKKLSFTIGVEIECFGFDKHIAQQRFTEQGIKSIVTGYNHEDSNEHFKLGSDGSICGHNSCEIVSPILRGVKCLKTVLQVVNDLGAQTNKSCGLHVHFGASKFSISDWIKIIKNYQQIEIIIDSFMPQSRRNNNNHYCRSIRDINILDVANYESINDIQEAFRFDRYFKLNVQSYSNHKTIEFRQHSGTTDFTKIENWVNFLALFLEWSLKNDELLIATTIDELPFLNKKLKTFYKNRVLQLS